MQSRLITVCALLAALFFTLSLTPSGRLADAVSASGQEPAVSGNSKNPAHDCSPVAALDECIQKRFSAMDRFGIRRVITYPYHLQHFRPENETEKSVVAELERQGWTVSFYLAGRSVLEAKPDKALWEKSAGYFYKRKPINNPVLLTKDAGIEDLPKPLELWDQTQQAMKAFSRTEQYEFSVGRWQFTARPVRASQAACLQCHNQRTEVIDGQVRRVSPGLKIGAPLGAVLYACARARQ